MGLKLRLGLAGLGLALSSMFGVNMLSGVKDYVDTTGNIMVDIADGIGMVSKGIEALEYYLDPSSTPEETTTPFETPPTAPPKASAPVNPSVEDGSQPRVFCQKGKCYPYDPAKMKNSNINLEAKPGMILTAPTPAPKNNRKRRQNDDKDEEENAKETPSGKFKARQTVTNQNIKSAPKVSDASGEILVSQTPATENSTNSTTPVAHGTKRLLGSIRDLLDRTSKVIVKFVHRIFPWNRRARRRVMGDGDDDEL